MILALASPLLHQIAHRHPPYVEATGTETQALVGQRDAVVGRLFHPQMFPPLPLDGPSIRSEAFAQNRQGLRALIMAYLSAKLLFLWDTEFYSRKTHAFFGFTWQICGGLFDWSGTMV